MRTESHESIKIFDRFIRTAHWFTLFLIVTIFLLAVSFRFATSREQFTTLVQFHRSFGLTVWVVTAIRLVWRQFAEFPNWPPDMPQAMRLAAHASEYAFYALLLLQPILGLLYTNARGERVDLFFLGRLPAIIGPDRQLARPLLAAHETVAILFLGLLALHVSAALYHHYVRRDGTLNAMLPTTMRRKM